MPPSNMSTRKYWYKIYHTSCPICGSEIVERERHYGSKPKYGTHDWIELWDGCNVF